MRLLATNLRDITDAIRSSSRQVLLTKILKDCLDSATLGRDYAYFDIEFKDISKEQMHILVSELENLRFRVEYRIVEDEYYDMTVRW